MLLLGTKEEVPVEPIKRTVFIEDMDEAELASAVSFFVFTLKMISLFYDRHSLFLDGCTSWTDKPGKYLLYECSSSMF